MLDCNKNLYRSQEKFNKFCTFHLIVRGLFCWFGRVHHCWLVTIRTYIHEFSLNDILFFSTIEKNFSLAVYIGNKTGVINDPLGQTHNPSSSGHHSHLKIVILRDFVTDGRMEEQTPYTKIVITTGHDCGSAEWINTQKSFYSDISCKKCSSLSTTCSFKVSLLLQFFSNAKGESERKLNFFSRFFSND